MTFKEYITQAKLKANAAGDVMRLGHQRRDMALPCVDVCADRHF